ncbi:MAG: hypothetical protein C0624_02585 [Desulfuromonas sp.]|nr:MAG: hypothetical protein C0624_02585 [Desulfuromonas sp.]
MTNLSAENQTTHDEMLLKLVNNLIGKGYQEIRATTLPEFADLRPAKIYSSESARSFIPDVTAFHNGNLMLFEIETVNSVLAPLTHAKLRAFATYASEHQAAFYLVMSDQDRALAQATMAEINHRDLRRSFALTL